MEQNKNYSRLSHYVIAMSTLIFVLVAMLGLIAFKHDPSDAAPKPKIPAPVVSMFSFTGAAGWNRGATNKTSMAVFHTPHNCFVSGEYHTGIINSTAALQAYQAQLTSSDYTVTSTGVQPLSLKTNTGSKSYQIQQYTASGSGSGGQIEGGQELGYLQLNGGYIKVEGYCDTPSELTATIPALQAITFDSTR